MKRAYYIDNLRIVLTALVIVHHSAIAYGASGGWCYISSDTIKGWTQLLFSAFLSINQAFFMSLFFFISAYFTPDSFDKKGLKKFLTDRLIRLGIPLFIYSILINPCLSYFIILHQNNVGSSLFDYIISYNIINPNTSHLWFILALLIFESFYALFRIVFASEKIRITNELPSQFNILVFILITGLLAFLLRLVYPIGGKNIIGLQLGYFVLYIAMYLKGINANRKKWLDKLTIISYQKWVVFAFIIIPLIVFAWIDVTKHPGQIAYYIGGFNWKALFLSYWEAIVCVGLTVFFLSNFKKYINNSNVVTKNMSADSYAVYIIHPLIIVGMTILFEIIILKPVFKLVIVAILSIFFSFIFAHAIRLIPGIKRII